MQCTPEHHYNKYNDIANSSFYARKLAKKLSLQTVHPSGRVQIAKRKDIITLLQQIYNLVKRFDCI